MKQGIFKKISTFLLGSILALGVGVAVSAPHKDATRVDAGTETVSYTVASVITSTGYTKYENSNAIVTFGGNNGTLGTSNNTTNWSNMTLSNYSKYAVSPVTASDKATAFVLKVKNTNVTKMVFSTTDGTNVGNGRIYAIYSSDNTTFQQLSITSGTAQGATPSSKAATYTFNFNSCTGYFGILIKSTATSGNWKYDGGTMTLTYTTGTPATGVSLESTNYEPVDNKVELDLGSGQLQDTLTATVTPADATDKTVTWTSSNSNIATVSSGNVTISTSEEGEATITATANGGVNVSASITYKIVDNRVLTDVTKEHDPNKLTGYVDGDTFDTTGMVVNAWWSNTKDTTKNIVSDIEWANGGVLSEGQTQITGYYTKDTNNSYPVTVTGLEVAAPSYDNDYNLKGRYLIKHYKSSAGKYYYLKSNGNTGAPDAVESKDEATVFAFKLVGDNTFQLLSGTDVLYCTDTNNGLRVGTTNIEGQGQWKVKSPGTKTSGTYDFQNVQHTTRYISLYSTQDFRVYDKDHVNRTENTDLEAVKTISSFDIVPQEGAKTRWLKDSTFNYSTDGYKAIVTYDDNTSEDVSSVVTWSLDTGTVTENATLTASYKNNAYNDSISGLEIYIVTADKLLIDASQAKTTYIQNDTLDTSNLVIKGLNLLDEIVIDSISASQCTFSPTALETIGNEITITVTYTNVDDSKATGTYTVKVEADAVTALSWTKRPGFNDTQSNYETIWGGETTLGDLITRNGEDGAGVFQPTWKSAKSDSPIYGTSSHQVHIGLYDIPAPTVEGTPLSLDYIFQNTDNNKYVVAFYEGKASSSNKQLTVTKWRSVIGDLSVKEVFNYSSGQTTPSKSGEIASASIATSGYTASATGEKGIRLGSGSNYGRLTVTSSTQLIYRIEASVKVYGSDGSSIKIGTDEKNTTEALTSSYVTYGIDFTNPVSEAYVTTLSGNKRAYVESVTIYSYIENGEIGKTDDCVGLEKFIDKYLRSDLAFDPDPDLPINQTTECESLYPSAKKAFNGEEGDYKLNEHQRELFATNSAYKNEYDRLMAWATHVGDSLNETTYSLERINQLNFFNTSENSSASVILIISVISLATLGGTVLIRKRKEQE